MKVSQKLINNESICFHLLYLNKSTNCQRFYETQPSTSENEILEPLEEESRDSDKTPSKAIIDIQTPTLQKSVLSKNIETPQDIRTIRAQFFVLKNHVMYEFSVLNQKIISLPENYKKAINDMN